MININIQKKLSASNGAMTLDLALDIGPGELIALYGHSGAGKTSTLRMLAGLMRPDSGKITVDNKTWFDHNAKINIRPQDRNIGFVFQDYALFPNMTVFENLNFASKNKTKVFINELINITELGDLKNSYPSHLSGGQQQRVALARAVAQQPNLLLLDEPLSAVDSELREKLQHYIKKIHQHYQLTTLMISHDQKEILQLADRCVVLSNGKITANGGPTDIFYGAFSVNDSKMSGKIIHIEIKDDSAIITLEIQGNLIRSNISLEKIQNYRIGDFITFREDL